MKCPHCHAMCADSDKVCYTCHQPVAGGARLHAGETGGRMPVPQRCALLAIALGYAIANFAIPTDSTSRTKGGIDWGRVMLSGTVCAVFAPIGYGLGELLTRRRKEEA